MRGSDFYVRVKAQLPGAGELCEGEGGGHGVQEAFADCLESGCLGSIHSWAASMGKSPTALNFHFLACKLRMSE